ncbi:hypothetical protein F4604DRAFT_1925083 [Suillus subluteus]|nr:hypothetical protein F4604DRAFT_1925083 [Suillus subluteus]
MLPSGDYKIQNFLHKDRFVHMEAEGAVVGFKDADDVELLVTDPVLGLGTLFDKLRHKYIVIDREGKVVGSAERQVLQFSTEGDGKYTIHEMNINEVWVLNEDRDLTPIVTAPAPPPSVKDHEKKYWLFVRVF